MKLSTIQRWGGVSIIIGSILFTCWAVFRTTLLPLHERGQDISIIILNPNWIWISSLALPGTILMIFGFTAVYSRMYSSSGILGFIGYVFIVLAYLFQAAQITWEIFLFPVIASHGQSVALFRDKILMVSPYVRLYSTMAEATIFSGVILFCLTLLKNREFPKIAGILIFCGAIIYAIGPMITVYVAIAGVVILSIGCFVLGRRLFSASLETKI